MPIQQHPLPQDISSYKFRLIGDMTIKQFLYIAGFIILTILIHNSPIPFFFRYPIEIFTLGLGIGLAFVPVQGRPLDKWIIAFIKSVYSPTQYTWQQKQEETPKAATRKAPTQTSTQPPKKSTHPALSTSTTTIDLSPSTPTPKNIGNAKAPQKAKTSSSIKLTADEPVSTKPSKPKEKSVPTPQTPTVTDTPLSKPPKKDSQSDPSTSSTPPSTNLPIPFTPDQPNTIVGLTLNPQSLILDGVLIEIISSGLTIRATKSNKLGQFLFAKALENGTYQIKAERDGFNFITYSITLEGKILKPLKIQAKS